MKFLKALEQGSYKILQGFIIVCLTILLILIFLQVVCRYFQIPIVIYDEVLLLFTVWFVFLGAALLVRDNDHIWIDLIRLLFKRKPKLWHLWQIIIQVIILSFLIIMLISSLTLVELGGIVSSAMLFWPQRWWYLSIAVSAGLMILYTLMRIFHEIRVLGFVCRQEEES